MRLIQKYLPDPHHTEINRIFVKASSEEAWKTARHFDMGKVPWVRLLFDIRTLPERIKGKLHEEDRRIGIDQIADNENGFHILEEKPGKEVVVGAIGKFWLLNIPFSELAPFQFKEFDDPGFGKIAWSISVEPYREGSTISMELRITATDESSWRKFFRYYRLIGVGSRLIRNSLMHQMETLLGKLPRLNDDELDLPGDEIIPACKYQSTLATDIEAPPAIVWRYLMQLGCDRAGWYSIDAFDHGGKPSIDRLVEGWETRKKGEKIAALPSFKTFFDVYEVKHEKHFLLGGEYPLFGHPYRMTWVFVVEPIGYDATHLIARARMHTEPAFLEWSWGHLVASPTHFIMQKVQLRNIKKIAERDSRERSSKIEKLTHIS